MGFLIREGAYFYILAFTPYTLHPTPYTLHPTPIIKFYLKNLQVRKFFTTFVPKLSVLSKYAANIKNY